MAGRSAPEDVRRIGRELSQERIHEGRIAYVPVAVPGQIAVAPVERPGGSGGAQAEPRNRKAAPIGNNLGRPGGPAFDDGDGVAIDLHLETGLITSACWHAILCKSANLREVEIGEQRLGRGRSIIVPEEAQAQNALIGAATMRSPSS